MDKIYFTVNGEHYTLTGSEVSPLTSLYDYLHNYLQLFGTKAMCHVGGCGACVVSVTKTHPVTKEKHTIAVNSCIVHVLSCHQWDITTVEGIGNRKDGYHPIQSRLAAFNGTQCGYCTSGWIMNMFSLYQSSKSKLSAQEVEKSFGGNICRCTGYRPILDAFKSFANDAAPDLKNKLQDVEDLHELKCLKKCEKTCTEIGEDWCVIDNKRERLMEIGEQKNRWYKAYTISDVFKVLRREGFDNYKFISGNTGVGVFNPYWSRPPRVFVDISSIETIRDYFVDVNLVVGSGVTLTELMNICQTTGKTDDFNYLKMFYDHLDLVANVSIKNIGTIGGNLAMKHENIQFPSDVFLLLELIQAMVTIVNSDLKETMYSMQDFLKTDLSGKIITAIRLPPVSSRCVTRSYKIMPRAQNSLAIVNAGFYYKLNRENKIEEARIVYGGISPTFVRATETENALTGQILSSENTLQLGLSSLDKELEPLDNPPNMSPWCRKNIALGLFYRAILSLNPSASLNTRYISGASPIYREVSRGTQTFDTDKNLWPLNKPVPKLEALAQCSGEVSYACDVVPSRKEVHVAFVLSTICLGEIDHIDASEALKIPGVVGFLTAKDIPGENTFIPSNSPWHEFQDELLATKKISYYGQPIALIAANTQTLAISAADIVKVTYKKSESKPVLSIKEALLAPDNNERLREDANMQAKTTGNNTTHVIKGSYYVPSQYHFTMETQSCHVSFDEDVLVVRPATQWIDLVHLAVAKVLGMDQNRIRVIVNRVGGGYGAKGSRSAMTACACALVARVLHRPASLILPLRHNMQTYGKRQDCYAEYEVGVDDNGVIQYLNLTYYTDCGSNYNDTAGPDLARALTSLYASDAWTVRGYSVLTDKVPNTWCRAPATTEGTAIAEHIMERIAFATKRDPIDVRISNLSSKHLGIKDMIYSFVKDTNYIERKAQIAIFNNENAWKKKGLKLGLMSYHIGYALNLPVTVSVYHGDGTVAVSHGGIEMGQGIHTKVAQVCAYTLKVPLEKISMLNSDSFISPNSVVSSGSFTSECAAYAALKACEDLLRKLEPVRSGQYTPWEETIKRAYEKGINLQSSYMWSQSVDNLKEYDVYGVCITETELDVLTGSHQVLRVDLLEDVGISLSPEVDVGQIEGAFIMGLGLWTSEQLIYDRSGRLLTDNTWQYHPPGARDVPIDFRVTFRRNAANPAGVLRSKATGEPALTLSVTVCHALREAILEARKEFGYTDNQWLDIDAPFTIENILKAISPKYTHFKLN